GGRDGRVDDGRNGAFEDRIRRRTSILRIVVRPLDVVEGGRDVDRAAQVSVRWQTAAAYGGEVGELRERDVDLERGARVVDALDGGYELGGQLLLLQQLEERDVRVGVRDDLPGLILGPVFERHALHPPAPGDDLRHRAVHANLGPVRARRGGEGLRDSAHPAAHVAP